MQLARRLLAPHVHHALACARSTPTQRVLSCGCLTRPVRRCTGAECTWNATVATLNLTPGYWRLSNTSLDIRACWESNPNFQEACAGGSDAGIDGSGYCRTDADSDSLNSGPLCRVCSDGYFFDEGECTRCPSGGGLVHAILVMALVVIGAFVVIGAVYRLARTHSFLRKWARILLGQIAATGPVAKGKIVFAFLQLTLVLPSVYEVSRACST